MAVTEVVKCRQARRRPRAERQTRRNQKTMEKLIFGTMSLKANTLYSVGICYHNDSANVQQRIYSLCTILDK